MPSSLITVAEARALVLSAVTPLPPEDVPIDAALDRVLDAEVRAAGNVPPFACSAMDGYAILAGPSGRRLTVVGESRAGAPTDQPVADGQAIRISTGAAIPAGADAVIPQEQVSTHGGDQIETQAEITEGEHVRRPGEDMAAGLTVLRAGIRLGPVELGAAVAAGAGSLSVARAPRVSVLATGDDHRPAGEPLRPGEIHNSNAPMLAALAGHAGARTPPPRQLADEREATRAGIAAALESSEVVVISGGVSVGPHDHVKPALADLGVTEVFWSVALQPGKPTWFGRLGGQLVFGLPGNPVSAVVTFSLFVLPALNALQGRAEPRRLEAEAALGQPVKRNPRREQAIRVILQRGPGPTTAVPNGAQGSHILTSLLGADALAMIPAGDGMLPAGTPVALEELAQ
jgi:molybdopterin molybdotransferase